MNALAALSLSLPGCADPSATYRERGQIAYETGVRAVGIVIDAAVNILTARHREHHRRQLGDRRLDDAPDPYKHHRPPRGP